MIEVVGGIIVKNGRIFLQQRPALKDFGFCWESPGGKVNAGESHHEALRRELLEELGIDIGELPPGLKPVWSGTFENAVTRPDRSKVLLHFYMIGDLFTGQLALRDSQPGSGWFLPDEMLVLDLSPANTEAKHVIADKIRQGGRKHLLKCPAWTVVYNATAPGSTWIGTAWEFFDAADVDVAQRRYAELRLAGAYPTLRPYNDTHDRSHLGAGHL